MSTAKSVDCGPTGRKGRPLSPVGSGRGGPHLAMTDRAEYKGFPPPPSLLPGAPGAGGQRGSPGAAGGGTLSAS